MRRVLWLLVLFVAACAGLGGLSQKPDISLAALDLLEMGVFEQRFVMTLRVQNPNDVDLPIRGMTFDIELNGQHFAKGLSDKAVTIPRMGEALLEVRATSNLGSVLRQLRELQKGGRERIDYRLYGQIALDGLGRLPFERKGDLQMPIIDAPRKQPPTGERT